MESISFNIGKSIHNHHLSIISKFSITSLVFEKEDLILKTLKFRKKYIHYDLILKTWEELYGLGITMAPINKENISDEKLLKTQFQNHSLFMITKKAKVMS